MERTEIFLTTYKFVEFQPEPNADQIYSDDQLFVLERTWEGANTEFKDYMAGTFDLSQAENLRNLRARLLYQNPELIHPQYDLNQLIDEINMVG